MTQQKTILFRADGGTRPDVGTGHIARSLLLADALQSQYHIVFASQQAPDLRFGHERIAAAGYECLPIAESDYIKNINKIIKVVRPDFVVCDLYEYTEVELQLYNQHALPVLTYDHTAEHVRYSTFPINAVLPEQGGAYSGPRYFVMPPPLLGADQDKAIADQIDNVFVCFGGYDHLHLTEKVCRALHSLQARTRFNVVCAPQQAEFLRAEVGTNFHFYHNPPEFRQLIHQADLAFTAGGLTLFECLAHGLPVVAIAQYPHQWQTMQDFAYAEAFVSLGPGEQTEVADVAQAFQKLAASQDQRRELSRAARRLVDGQGLARVADLICQTLAVA